MKFHELKKNYKNQIVIGALTVCVVGGLLTFNLAKTKDVSLIEEKTNEQFLDTRTIAAYIENDTGDYVESNDVPTDGYTINTEKSMCRVYDGSTSIENAPKDERVTINYHDGVVGFDNVSKKNTRCYLYFDKIKDTTKPTITNVTASVTKTEINVSVTATDDKGVTEYWYQLNDNTPVKGTGNTYQFTGLSAGTTYTIKVYVKDAAGNQSDTTTKSVQTTPNNQTITSILAGITVKSGTPDFSQVATIDEGVYKVSDPVYGGYSYYWRGATTNNYVKFAGFCWRIVRINSDKTMRLIYDGTTCHVNGTSTAESIAKTSVAYNTISTPYRQSNHVGWTYEGTSQRTLSGTSSNAKTQLESWYNSNLTSHAAKIADGKYCNDRNVQSGDTWSISGNTFYSAAYERMGNDTPTLACPSGDMYTLKVGLITTDEVIYAGGNSVNNTSYYLYNGQLYWTMTPFNWSGGWPRVFVVRYDGRLDLASTNDTRGLRPVINLKSNTQFQAGGNGTLDNPYVVQ